MFQLVDAEKAHHPVQVPCDALEVSRSGFYAWKKRPPAARVASDEQLAVEIAATHAKSTRRYGSPRIHRAFRKRGIRVGRKRVVRVMREKGIVGRLKRRFRVTTDSNHPNPIAPNLVARDFAPEAPNKVWAGDVTYIATSEGWAYLAVLLDLLSHATLAQRASDRVGRQRLHLFGDLAREVPREEAADDRAAMTEQRDLLGRGQLASRASNFAYEQLRAPATPTPSDSTHSSWPSSSASSASAGRISCAVGAAGA